MVLSQLFLSSEVTSWRRARPGQWGAWRLTGAASKSRCRPPPRISPTPPPPLTDSACSGESVHRGLQHSPTMLIRSGLRTARALRSAKSTTTRTATVRRMHPHHRKKPQWLRTAGGGTLWRRQASVVDMRADRRETTAQCLLAHIL